MSALVSLGNKLFFQLQMIDPLPPIDHSEINYAPFEKNFYEEHEEVSKLTDQQVEELRSKLDIRVGNSSICAY